MMMGSQSSSAKAADGMRVRHRPRARNRARNLFFMFLSPLQQSFDTIMIAQLLFQYKNRNLNTHTLVATIYAHADPVKSTKVSHIKTYFRGAERPANGRGIPKITKAGPMARQWSTLPLGKRPSWIGTFSWCGLSVLGS